jgi:glycosyltransferase involved in cell wall biosynthesis
VAALAERIRRLAADPALRARFGAAARRKARAEFDQQRVIDTTLEVYERLLASRGRRPALAGAGR